MRLNCSSIFNLHLQPTRSDRVNTNRTQLGAPLSAYVRRVPSWWPEGAIEPHCAEAEWTCGRSTVLNGAHTAASHLSRQETHLGCLLLDFLLKSRMLLRLSVLRYRSELPTLYISPRSFPSCASILCLPSGLYSDRRLFLASCFLHVPSSSSRFYNAFCSTTSALDLINCSNVREGS